MSEALTSPLPKSATSPWTAFAGVLGLVLTSIWLKNDAAQSPDDIAVVLLLATALPMLITEFLIFKIFRNVSSGLDWNKSSALSLSRSSIKLLGLLITVSIIALLYAIIPIYEATNYFPQFTKFVMNSWPIFVMGALIYFPLIDSKMKNPIDGYYMIGAFFLGRRKGMDAFVVKNFVLGWLVKAFFTPIMYGFLVNSTARFGQSSLTTSQFTGFYVFFYDYLFLIDLCFGALGYLCTLRILDAHIRTAEPSFLGWAVALVCYTPFQEGVLNRYLAYDDKYFWGNWLTHDKLPYILWGSIILALTFVYAWATVCFGFRFSNLTSRGIITSGPYRFSKHPAYVSKNITWWMISIPFISMESTWAAISHSLLLVGVNIIYFLRARTEERNLSQDPTYVQYALSMNRHSCLAFLGKAFPQLLYRAPKAS